MYRPGSPTYSLYMECRGLQVKYSGQGKSFLFFWFLVLSLAYMCVVCDVMVVVYHPIGHSNTRALMGDKE